jgi:hypothetical protein
MTAVARSPAIPLHGVSYNVESKPNPAATKGGFTRFKDYVGSADGAYKFTDLFTKVFKESIEIASLAGSASTVAALKGPGAVFSKLSGAFIFPYFAFASVKLKESAEKVANEGPSDGRVENLVKDSLGWVTSGCYATLNFVDVPVLGSIAKVTDLAGDSIELKQEVSAWTLADDLMKTHGKGGVSSEIHHDLVEEKKLRFLGIIKAVVSVVGGIFAVLALILGAAVVPGIVAASLSLVGISMAFIKHFYRENMDQKVTIQREVVVIPATLNETAGV